MWRLIKTVLLLAALAAAGVLALSNWQTRTSAVLEQLVRLDQRLPMPTAATAAMPVSASAVDANPLLAVKSWGYQLQQLRLPELTAAPYDLLVIDYSRAGTEDTALTRAEIARLKVKPDGTRRIVLCYLSIGEAEDYRYYWNPDWKQRPPAFLGKENRNWRGNYAVRFWLPEWQQVILGREDSYLEKIISLGFDGVYLDRIDGYSELEAEREGARSDMVGFVRTISARAKGIKPGFLVVAQNAEELLQNASYRAVIDGIAKEDPVFGEHRESTLNKESQIQEVYRYLLQARGDRKAVFVVDYIADPELRARTAEMAMRRNFIPHFARRDLARLSLHPLPVLPEKPGD